MLFHLQDNVKFLAEQHNPPNQFLQVIADLFNARRHGRHVIFASTATLDALASMPGLASITVQTIKTIRKKVIGKKSLFENAGLYISITAEENVFRCIPKNGKTIIEISLSKILGDELFQNAILLAENLHDADFYEIVTRSINKINENNGNIKFSVKTIGGGGSTTPQQYKHLQAGQQLVLCIVDSDKEYPASPLGKEVAKKIDNLDKNTPWPLAKGVILDCYSVENLIPVTLIAKHNTENHSPEWIAKLLRFNDLEFWPFLRLKEAKYCSHFNGNMPKNIYWQGYKPQIAHTDCPIGTHPETGNKCEGNCVVFESVSKYTLRDTLKSMQALEESNSHELMERVKELPDPIEQIWQRVAREVTNWGCSGDRLTAP